METLTEVTQQMDTYDGLFTQKYTRIEHDEPEFGAPHVFVVSEQEFGKILTTVRFQKGPVKEHGINGVHNEDLLAMVYTRLKGFQATPFACKENELAIAHIEGALTALRARTNERESRGVEGTNVV